MLRHSRRKKNGKRQKYTHYPHGHVVKRKRTNSSDSQITKLLNGDFTAPGYNNLGPGNKLRKPTNYNDAVAYKHDVEYNKMLSGGKRAYTQYSNADEEFLKNLKPNDIPTYAAKGIFTAKKAAHSAGLIGHTDKPDEGFFSAKNIGKNLLEWGGTTLADAIVPGSGEIIRGVSGAYKAAKAVSNFITPEQKKRTLETPGISPGAKRSLTSELATSGTDPGMAGEDVKMTDEKANALAADGPTPVEHVGHEVFTPFPRYQNTILPFYRNLTLMGVDGTNSTRSMTFRLNTPIDCITEGNVFTANPGYVVPAVDANIQKPMMYDYWKLIYQYYHVYKTEYKFRFWTTTTINSECDIFIYHHGMQYPPYSSAAAKRVPSYIRRRHPGIKDRIHLVNNPNKISGASTNFSGVSQFKIEAMSEGTWVPGSITHDVVEDELNETWTKVDFVPNDFDLMTVVVQTGDRTPTSAFEVLWDVELTYHVQFKDLSSQYQFLTHETQTPVATLVMQTSGAAPSLNSGA
jgi:hypothetical protein